MTWWYILSGVVGLLALASMTPRGEGLLLRAAVWMVRRAAHLQYAGSGRAALRAEEWAGLVHDAPTGLLRFARATPFLLAALAFGQRRPFLAPGWSVRSRIDMRPLTAATECSEDDPQWAIEVAPLSAAWAELCASVDAALPSDWAPANRPWARLRWRYAATGDRRWAHAAADARALRDPWRHFYGDVGICNDQGVFPMPGRTRLVTPEAVRAYLTEVDRLRQELRQLAR